MKCREWNLKLQRQRQGLTPLGLCSVSPGDQGSCLLFTPVGPRARLFARNCSLWLAIYKNPSRGSVETLKNSFIFLWTVFDLTIVFFKRNKLFGIKKLPTLQSPTAPWYSLQTSWSLGNTCWGLTFGNVKLGKSIFAEPVVLRDNIICLILETSCNSYTRQHGVECLHKWKAL